MVETQTHGSCYFGVITSPYYIEDGEEFDPHRDPRRNHLCVNPEVGLEHLAQGQSPDSIDQDNGRRIFATKLGGFTVEQPAECLRCPHFRVRGLGAPADMNPLRVKYREFAAAVQATKEQRGTHQTS